MALPRIIQGGMGIGVSSWKLARTVSRAGQLGVVSGTGIWLVMARQLQLGDPGGHIWRALERFPSPAIVERILRRYFIPGGKRPDQPYRDVPMLTHPLRASTAELLVAGSFAEVWLAKEGHDGIIGVNYLEKIQLCLLPSLYGAMLAGVDFVLMGAGIPVQVPEALDLMARHEPAYYRLYVEGAQPDEVHEARFDPRSIPMETRGDLKRPAFLPIISSHVLAQMLLRRSKGTIQGFVVEGPTAGGHNAPPRNRKELTPDGEPVYGPQDEPDLEKLRALGLPFWLAGSRGSPESLRAALAQGAQGIQAGSIFALSAESGLRDDLRTRALSMALEGKLAVRTNPNCSPSGYPFKEAQLPGTLTDPDVSRERQPVCDIGCLRTLYRRDDGRIGYRCPAEPLEQFLKKGGAVEETTGRRCICNALTGAIGLGQYRPDSCAEEPPLLTLGSDLSFLPEVAGTPHYHAADALEYLLRDSDEPVMRPESVVE